MDAQPAMARFWIRPLLDLCAHLVLPAPCSVCGGALGSEAGRLGLPVLWCAACRARLEREAGGPAVTLGGWTAQGRFWYEGPVANAIRRVKEGGPGAGALLDRLAEDWHPQSMPGPPIRLVPVPSHARRRRERGGDHVDRLARRWARTWGLKVARPLRRRGGGHQIGLGARERLANLAGQYRLARQPGAPGPLWLVDDVVTTGATVLACARILEEAGWQVEGAVALACTPAPALRGGALAGWERLALEVHEDDPHAP
jgi:predicted amidophosphoribosyltransferase